MMPFRRCLLVVATVLMAVASGHAAEFHFDAGTITLRREVWTLPESLPFGDGQLKPLRGGETLSWRLIA